MVDLLRIRKENDKRFANSSPDEFVVCNECLCKCVNVSLHIRRCHPNFTVEQYKEEYPDAALWPVSYKKEMSSRMKAEVNNPFRGHEGKFSPFSLKSGKSEEEVRSCIEKAAVKRSYTSRPDYWLKRGMTLEEATTAVKERQTTFSMERCVSKYGKEEGERIFLERQNRWLKTLQSRFTREELYKLKIDGMLRAGTSKPLTDFLKDEKAYRKSVASYTSKSISIFGLRPSRDLHVDHMYSVIEGFRNMIPPFIIGSICNLQLLSATENSSKKSNCSMTVGELYEKYRRFVSESGSEIYREFCGRRLRNMDGEWVAAYQELEQNCQIRDIRTEDLSRIDLEMCG